MDHRKWILLFLVLLLANPVLAQNNIVKIIGEQAVQDSDWTKINVDVIDSLDSAEIKIKKGIRVYGKIKPYEELIRFNRSIRPDIYNVHVPHAYDHDSLKSVPAGCTSGECVHVDVDYYPGGWNGYSFWMIYTPMPSGCENPHVAVSNTGRDFDVPSGGSNPIDSVSDADKNNTYMSDCDLLFGMDGKLWAGYRQFDGKGVTGTDTIVIMAKSTLNGTSWSSRESLLVWDYTSDGDPVSPSWVIWNGKYRMYYVEGTADPRELRYKEADEFNGTYGSHTVCYLDATPSGKELWHFNIFTWEDMLVALITFCQDGTAGTASRLFLAYSFDGDSFTVNTDSIMGPGESGAWDDDITYRSTGVPYNYGDQWGIALWYPNSDGSKWQVGYTRIYFGVKSVMFEDWEWAPHDPEDSVTTWRLWESDNYPWVLKFENESSQADQYDTTILYSFVPEGLPEYYDSNFLEVDSIQFSYKTSSTDTNTAGVNFGVFKHNTWNGDTVQVYRGKSVTSATANVWKTKALPPDSLASFNMGEKLSIWVVTKLDASATVTIGKPILWYKTQ